MSCIVKASGIDVIILISHRDIAMINIYLYRYAYIIFKNPTILMNICLKILN